LPWNSTIQAAELGDGWSSDPGPYDSGRAAPQPDPSCVSEPDPGLTRELPLGVATGVLSGVFGVGGGTVLVPGLVWMGFAQHAAHATSLAAIILTAAAAAVPFALDGEIAPIAVAALVPGALIGAVAGAAVMHRVPARGLRIAFVVLMVGVAIRLLVGVEPATTAGAPDLTVGALIGLVAVGLGTGLLSAVLGVGGGLVLIPALVLLFGFPQHAAEGTSLAVIVPTALAGATRHARHGYTKWRTGMVLGTAGIVGGVTGGFLALALEGGTLQRIFAVFLLLMAGRLMWQGRA
jgi:uncharacterized protein